MPGSPTRPKEIASFLAMTLGESALFAKLSLAIMPEKKCATKKAPISGAFLLT
jgi:hypothetical protein